MAGKKRKNTAHPVFQSYMGLVTVIFLISASVTLVLYLVPLYYLNLVVFDVPEKAQIPYEICRRNYNAIADYNMLFGARELTLPDFPMSEHGRIHFAEVRKIFFVLQIAAGVSGILLLFSAPYVKKKKAYGWIRAVTVGISAIIAAAAAGFLLDSRGTLILMHRILFRDDYWWFDPATDPVIRIMPESVFAAEGMAVIVFIAAGLVILELIRKKHAGGSRGKTRTAGKRKNKAAGK